MSSKRWPQSHGERCPFLHPSPLGSVRSPTSWRNLSQFWYPKKRVFFNKKNQVKRFMWSLWMLMTQNCITPTRSFEQKTREKCHATWGRIEEPREAFERSSRPVVRVFCGSHFSSIFSQRKLHISEPSKTKNSRLCSVPAVCFQKIPSPVINLLSGDAKRKHTSMRPQCKA